MRIWVFHCRRSRKGKIYMKMEIAHTGRTGKDTSVTFDTDRKIYCLSREEHDVYIYAEQTKDVKYVIYDLIKLGYTEVSCEEFRAKPPGTAST